MRTSSTSKPLPISLRMKERQNTYVWDKLHLQPHKLDMKGNTVCDFMVHLSNSTFCLQKENVNQTKEQRSIAYVILVLGPVTACRLEEACDSKLRAR